MLFGEQMLFGQQMIYNHMIGKRYIVVAPKTILITESFMERVIHKCQYMKGYYEVC